METFFPILKYSVFIIVLFYFSFLAATYVRHVALPHGIYSISPSGSRIALWGGLAFMLPYAVYAPVLLGLPLGYAIPFFLAIFSFVLFGLLDDVIGFSPLPQMATQVVVSLALLYIFYSVERSSMGWAAIEALPFVLFLIASMNALNWMDGLDGLAGATFFAALLPLAGLFVFQGDTISSVIIFSFLGSLAGFLLLNCSPAKLYMGTVGSMGLGLFAGVIVATHPNLLPLLLCSLAVPLGDACRVSIQRVLGGSVPWQGGDRRHLHYQLFDRGMSVSNILGLYVGATVIFSLFGIGAFLDHALFLIFLLPLILTMTLPMVFQPVRYDVRGEQHNAEKFFAKE